MLGKMHQFHVGSNSAIKNATAMRIYNRVIGDWETGKLMGINQFTVHNFIVIKCGMIFGGNASNSGKVFTLEN
jgi:hypothetical protein